MCMRLSLAAQTGQAWQLCALVLLDAELDGACQGQTGCPTVFCRCRSDAAICLLGVAQAGPGNISRAS